MTASAGFAAIVRKGSDEAGAIFIVNRERNGNIRLYAPAPQTGYEEGHADARQFQLVEHVVDDAALTAFESAESRFDPDFWLIELELNSEMPDLFVVMKP